MVMSAYCVGWHIIIFNILDNLWPLDFTEKNKKNKYVHLYSKARTGNAYCLQGGKREG